MLQFKIIGLTIVLCSLLGIAATLFSYFKRNLQDRNPKFFKASILALLAVLLVGIKVFTLG